MEWTSVFPKKMKTKIPWFFHDISITGFTISMRRRVRCSGTSEIYATGVIQNFAILEAFIASAYTLHQIKAYFLCYIY